MKIVYHGVENIPVMGKRPLYAVIGTPIAQSMSPVIHNSSFAHLGIDGDYIALDLQTDELKDAFAKFRTGGYGGINVTMPHKNAVIEYLDELSDGARLMGAVNTIEFRDGKLIGHNTDAIGLLGEIAKVGGQIKGCTTLIIGAGGTGAALITQAALDGAQRLIHANRPGPNLEAARDRAGELTELTGVPIDVVELGSSEFLTAVREAAIIIDCTMVGMGKLAELTNVPPELIRADHIIVDTVYYPRVTRLLADARLAGARTVDGLAMLVAQAAYGEKIWLNVDMPFDVVETALEKAQTKD
ncbi:MAG: shikimate dehydrogenase [Arcanobacterium sp.]